jgi:hypothetical protein
MMILQSQSFSEIASAAIEDAFRTLLETKHLYQSVEISTSGFASYIDREAQKEFSLQAQVMPGRGSSPSRSKEQILEDCRKKAVEGLRNMQCQMKFNEMPLQTGNFGISVPTIKAMCQNLGCGGLWPHNACPDPSWLIPASSMPSGSHQVFILRYQCQACKREPVSFLVKREGLKLTLVGRSPMEAVDVPKYVPKGIRKYYKGAVVAYNSGAVLPGIFMLRTMIEQHMRGAVNAGERKMTGDELADAYAATLDSDFNRRCQSLKPVYVALSEAIHAAIDDKPEIFDIERTKILSHFEAKEVFERLAVATDAQPAPRPAEKPAGQA